MKESRPNFFLLLGINPDDPWDDTRFHRVLQEKEQFWRRRRAAVGREGEEAQRNYALLDELKAVMQSSARRAQEAREARTSARDASPQPVSSENTPSRFDAALLTRVEQLLRKLDRPNVYAFFELPPSTPLDRLQRSVEGIQGQLAAQTSTDPYVRILREFLDCARIIFLTASNRQRYDESLGESASAERGPGNANGTSASVGATDSSRPVASGSSQAGNAEEIGSLPDKGVEKDQPLFHENAAQLPASLDRQPASPIKQEAAVYAQPRVVPRPARTDITELVLKNLDGAFNLKWVWPDDCTEALLAYSHLDWPRPGQPDVSQVRVTRAEYEVRGHYELHGPIDRPYYIMVAAILRKAGTSVVTKGETVQGYMARKLLVDYEIKITRFGARRRFLHLYTRFPGRIPTLLLRSCVGHAPLTKEEGVLFQRIEGPLEVRGELAIPLLKDPEPGSFGRLFLEDEDLYTVITLCKPPERKLSFGR